MIAAGATRIGASAGVRIVQESTLENPSSPQALPTPVGQPASEY